MPKPRRSANARTRARVPRGRAPSMSASCSEKLTADVALAHAPILQGPDDSSSEELLDNKSLKQLLIRNPKTELHNTINCSCSTYPLGPEKLLAGSAERFSVLPVQDPDVSSLDVFLDSSLEESITANQLSVPHNTIDGSSNTSPSSCGKLVAGTMESASAPILQGLDDLSLDDFLGSSSEESSEESNSPRTVPHNIANGSSSSAFSLGSILVRYPQKCLQMFYIRLDRSGSFWMYPYLGGPYKRIDDVDFAITLFDVTYRRDRTIRTKCLPDLAGDLNACYERNLVEALVDQYNDYHDISEGGALVLEDLLKMQMFFEEYRWYYHFNFTTEQLIAGKKLFFAEVSFTQGAKMYDVNSFCMIDSNEDGGNCYGCTKFGNPSVKHPKLTDAYAGGHLDVLFPFILKRITSDDEDSKEEEEAEDDDDDDESYFLYGQFTNNGNPLKPLKVIDAYSGGHLDSDTVSSDDEEEEEG